MKENVEIKNDSLKNIIFLSILKNAESIICFKKWGKGEKENYRSVSILPKFSNVFGRLV